MYAAELYLGAHRIYRRQQWMLFGSGFCCQMAFELSAKSRKIKEDQSHRRLTALESFSRS